VAKVMATMEPGSGAAVHLSSVDQVGRVCALACALVADTAWAAHGACEGFERASLDI
jgi:hypothetical protein